MLTATEVIKTIHKHGYANANNNLVVINMDALQFGVPVAQGDINLWILPSLPEGVIRIPTVRQLVEGVTRGSRHCIKAEDLHNVQCYRLPNPNPLQGNIYVFRNAITIEHPEHGDQLWGECILAVTYQRKYSQEIKRVKD